MAEKEALTEHRKGIEIILNYCMNKGAMGKDDGDNTINKKAESILFKYLSSKISYSVACKEMGHDKRIISAITCAKQILDTLQKPKSAKINCDANSLYGMSSPRYWDEEEDFRLLGGILIYGDHNFREVSSFVGHGRSRSQCLQRWSRTLNPRIKKDGWTPNEDDQLITLVKECIPLSWTRVANMLGARTDVQCRYRYQQLMKPRSHSTITCHKIVVPKMFEISKIIKPCNIDQFLSCFI